MLTWAGNGQFRLHDKTKALFCVSEFTLYYNMTGHLPGARP